MAMALLDGKYEGRGADVNRLQPESGWTPLMDASMRGNEDVVRLLLERGARLELQDLLRDTALHHAVAGHHAVVLEALCSSQGADAAYALRNKDFRTPLAIAVFIGRTACEEGGAHGAPA